MSASVLLGLVFAVATALTAVIGFLMKHRGASAAPPIEARRPVRTSLALFRSRWYTLGILVAMGSWGFHVAALAFAPISIAQAVIAAGLVFLTVAADRIFGLEVSRREWIGVGLAAAGLAIIAATLDGAAESAHDDYGTATLLTYVGVAALVGIGAAVAATRTPTGGPLLGISAGLLWGASDVCIKALAGDLGSDPIGTVFHPLALVILVASLVGLTVSARSLQIGPPVTVIALTTVAANVCTILSGPVVFGEPFPDDPGGVALRVAAFGMVIAAAALTPPPAPEPVPEPAAESA
jgi:drug/metabolite transporter (DMT)-like permease